LDGLVSSREFPCYLLFNICPHTPTILDL
jgi:hypothetical protein